jgi:hypothetical protein
MPPVIQDRSVATLGHRRREVRGGRHRADHVDRPGVEVLLRGEVADPIGLDKGGVVDDDLRYAVRLDHPIERGPQGDLVGHVGGHRQYVGTPELTHGSLHRRLRPRDQTGAHSLPDEPSRHRETDPWSDPHHDNSSHTAEDKRDVSPSWQEGPGSFDGGGQRDGLDVGDAGECADPLGEVVVQGVGVRADDESEQVGRSLDVEVHRSGAEQLTERRRTLDSGIPVAAASAGY